MGVAMRINKVTVAVLLGISALGLSACATGLRTQVSRYQAMPAPQDQSFVIVPQNPSDMGGLEFSRYAEIVAQRMEAQGYSRAPSINQATMVVQVGYGVSDPQTEVMTYPSSFGYGYGWGYPFYYGRRSYYWGWADPFWGGYGDNVRSYTYYITELDVDIRRKVDNASLFEGRAKARSRTDEWARTVPSLVEAMFTGFPGNSGETVKITIPPAPRQASN